MYVLHGSLPAAIEQLQIARAAGDGDFYQLLSRTVLTISHPAGEDGRLFGQVTAQEIVDAIRSLRGDIIIVARARDAEHARDLKDKDSKEKF